MKGKESTKKTNSRKKGKAGQEHTVHDTKQIEEKKKGEGKTRQNKESRK